MSGTTWCRTNRQWVDFQHDVTVADIELAERENYASVEHLKRYTTLGMGTDQGKTSNVNGLAILSALRGEPIPAVGTTTFRPPYTPVAFGAFAGPDSGKHSTPTRRTALHAWHVQRGISVIPKTVTAARLRENLAAADVELSADDLRRIAALDRNYRFLDGAFWAQPGSPWTLETLWDPA